VFQAMLGSDMVEKSRGMIKIEDADMGL